MPYRKRKYRKRKSRSTASRALRLARKAYNSTDHELKVRDEQSGAGALAMDATTATIILLNGLAEGDGRTERIGKQAKMVSIDLLLRLGISNAGTNTSFAVWLVLDKQPNAAVLQANALFEDSTGNAVMSPINLNNRLRFKVLHKYRLNLDIAYNSFVFKQTRKRLKFKTQFNGAGATIGNITSNALYAVIVTNAPAGTPASLQIFGRLRFVG